MKFTFLAKCKTRTKQQIYRNLHRHQSTSKDKYQQKRKIKRSACACNTCQTKRGKHFHAFCRFVSIHIYLFIRSQHLTKNEEEEEAEEEEAKKKIIM